jgi:hypothetical protein
VLQLDPVDPQHSGGLVPTNPQVRIDPDVGIPDLIRRLTDDSKRLAGDEVRLAKLELRENIHTGAHGTLLLALAFGAGVVSLIALTIALVAVVGRLVNGHYWLGALIIGVVELGLGFLLIKRGTHQLSEPSYSLAETRESLKDTTAWVTAQRAD